MRDTSHIVALVPVTIASRLRPHAKPMPYWVSGIYPMTACTVQGVAPYPDQAPCLALSFWSECFRRLNVKSGQRSFPEETRSALDIEGKHVTIQGPSPDLTPSVSRLLRDSADVRQAQVAMPAASSGSDRDNSRPTTSSGTRGARPAPFRSAAS